VQQCMWQDLLNQPGGMQWLHSANCGDLAYNHLGNG